MDEPLRDAAAIGVDDLKVAEPAAPAVARRRRWRSTAGAACCGSARSPALCAWSRTGWSSRYPSLLPQPLVVDRDDVVVAAVDTRRREGGETLRFPYSHEFEWTQPFPGDEAETYGWLYVRNARSPLPFLSRRAGAAEPRRRLPRRRCAARLPAPQAREPPAAPPARARPPGPRLLRARARRRRGPLALRDWGVMRPLTVGDAERAGAAVDAAASREPTQSTAVRRGRMFRAGQGTSGLTAILPASARASHRPLA